MCIGGCWAVLSGCQGVRNGFLCVADWLFLCYECLLCSFKGVASVLLGGLLPGCLLGIWQDVLSGC